MLAPAPADVAEPGRHRVVGAVSGFEQDGVPPLELGEGVWLRGRIDRVDMGGEGKAVVYDYKGRSAPPGATRSCPPEPRDERRLARGSCTEP